MQFAPKGLQFVRLRRSENVRSFSQQHAASTSCPLFALPWFGQSYRPLGVASYRVRHVGVPVDLRNKISYIPISTSVYLCCDGVEDGEVTD